MSSVLVGPSRSPEAAIAPLERKSREASRPWTAVSSRVYLPAAGVAALAAVLVGIGWSDDWGGERFAGSLTDLRVVLVGPVALAIIGIFLIVERLWPAQQRPVFARGYRHDLLLTIMNATLVAPLVTALTLSFMAVVRAGLPWIVLPTIGVIPRWGVIAVIVVAMDGLNWFVHLANHRVQMLWRFHELHHSQEDMSVLTVFRTHPLIHVSYLLALIPGVVLLANGAASITVLVVYGGIVAFAHSNTRLGFGPLGRVFVSPNYHRIHHQLNGPQDVNLGFALSIWDQIFHCAVFPSEATVRIDTGLPGRPLVVEQSTERPRHFSVLAAQLVAPFRPMHPSDVPPSSHRVADRRNHSEGAVTRAGDCLPQGPPEPAGELVSW
jgi:sterol desaturase/sphingolipid hydroxylase (fatty acid hydroxylase superfamily)